MSACGEGRKVEDKRQIIPMSLLFCNTTPTHDGLHETDATARTNEIPWNSETHRNAEICVSLPPPPSCENNTKIPKFDGNNTSCFSNKRGGG